MSNQRPGKTHRAAASDSTDDMRMRNFFRTCAEIYSDNSDIADFCQTIVEQYEAGLRLPSNPKDIQRMFGA
jgi:hypothetical protein